MLLLSWFGCLVLPDVERTYGCEPSQILNIRAPRETTWRFSRGPGCSVVTVPNIRPTSSTSLIDGERRSIRNFFNVGDGVGTFNPVGGLQFDWSQGGMGELPAQLSLGDRDEDEWNITAYGPGSLTDLPDMLQITCEDCTVDLRGRTGPMEITVDRGRVRLCSLNAETTLTFVDAVVEVTPPPDPGRVESQFAFDSYGILRVGSTGDIAPLQDALDRVAPGIDVVRGFPDPACDGIDPAPTPVTTF